MLKCIYIYYGILIPGWKTFRAFTSGKRAFIILWLKYWVIFTLFQGLGYLTDILFDGSPLYTLLKLVMAVILWLGYPDSTKIIYTLIDTPALRNLDLNLDNQGYMSLGQKLYQIFWSSDQENNPEEERGEPQVNAELLKRELSILMADISGGDTSNRESMTRQRNLHSYQHININYLDPRHR
ncbi:hypothetical protein KR054_002378, partial [Drosophila jambulina]